MARRMPLPDTEEPIADWLNRRERTFGRRQARRKAELWMPITVPEHQGRPFGVAFFGDMHADNPDCNIPLLRADLKAVATTPGMYGVHIGDGTDNWVGRLMSEHQKSETTQAQARRFIKWILHKSGVDWLCWLGGNHDKWNEGLAILGLLAGDSFYLPFWEAKLEIRCGREKWRVHAAHDFRGHSDWNITHGPLKAAYKGTIADLYVCGHKHDWGTQAFEIAGHGRVVHAARTRGYKWADDYATEHGFQSSQHGAGIVAIFDPRETDAARRVMLVPDIQRGCEILEALRRPKAAPKRKRK
jgi:hypothetical protein